MVEIIFRGHVTDVPQYTMLNVCLKIHETTLLDALEELFPQAGISINQGETHYHVLLFTPPESESSLPSLNFFNLSQPMRFVDLLSHLENLPYRQEITFGHFALDLREKILTNLKTHKTQRLTEKEVQLLRFLYQNRGHDVSKDKLLKEIWEYHPDAETHTLETHIYRLRQKLEEEPIVPQILLNGKEGYWIK